MTEIFAITIIFWIPILLILIKNFFWDLYSWQIKEFRWDRLWVNLRWDQDDLNRDHFSIAIKFILFACVTLLFKFPPIALVGIFLAYFIWTFQTFEFFQNAVSGRLIRPSLKNVRNLIIIILSIALIIVLVSFITVPFLEVNRAELALTDSQQYLTNFISTITTSYENYVYPDIYLLLGMFALVGLFLDLVSPFIIMFMVVITSPLALIRKYLVISKAIRKFESLNKDLLIIGVTGSQGKTTTKELLYEVLKDKYNVKKTPENYNTHFGIARAILTEIDDTTEIFIAEIGAYKVGEIMRVVSDFTPDISIITDIDTQHMALFGTQENLIEAKSEIVKYMKGNGTAILNGDNEFCRKVAVKLRNKVVLTSTDKSSVKEVEKLIDGKTSNLNLKKSSTKGNKVKLDLELNKKKFESFEIETKEDHMAEVALLVIAAAYQVGLTPKEISDKFKKLKFNSPRLSFETGDNNVTILDNSYSSSRKGFLSAVKTMNKDWNEKSNGKRIVITKGIYELGKEKKRIYKQIMDEIKNDVDILITTDSMLANIAMIDNLRMTIILTKKVDDIIYNYRKLASPGDIVLLQGRLHPKIIKEIVSDRF